MLFVGLLPEGTAMSAPRAALAVGCFALILLSLPASASEGVLPVRSGDEVSGVLNFCGDRHVLRAELVPGERLRLHVRTPTVELPTVRIFDPTGLDVSSRANLREVNGVILAGPVRAGLAGSHLISIATFSRHGLAYEAKARVLRKKRRRVRLGKRRPWRSFTVAAGSTLQLRGLRGTARVALGLPGEEPRQLEPDSAALTALLGDGLTAPRGGRYTVALDGGRGRARVRVLAPRGGGDALEFPELPAGGVADWYPDTGWVLRPGVSAPADHEPPVTVPDPDAPRPSQPTVQTVTEAPTASRSVTTRDRYADPAAWEGALSGLGMPLAPAPSIEEAVSLGAVETFGGGPTYAYAVAHEGFGTLTYRVSFLVGGVQSLAPLTFDGNVVMRWDVTGAAPFHQGSWTLSFDPDRGVEVLDGSETVVDVRSRAVTSTAERFTLPTAGGVPAGTLGWAVASPTEGNFTRNETYDGLSSVLVEVSDAGQARSELLPITQ